MSSRFAFEIAGRPIGPDAPVFIVAELSANHLGDRDRAHRLVAAAAQAGADGVKLQTFTPETITLDSEEDGFVVEGPEWRGRKLFELYGEASLPWDWHADLFRAAADLGMVAFSSPFDATAVDFLETLGAPAYKIASFEIVDLPLIARAARTGKPLLMSTGMSTVEEIAEAVAAARRAGASAIALLRCTSAYPAPPDELDLRTIPDMADRFGVPVGFSDHTRGSAAAATATALGAVIIEKHLTLSRDDGGPDAGFSAEPDELATLVDDVRTVSAALGRVRYGPSPRETANLAFRRSLFVVEDIARGEAITERNVRSVRPNRGLHPRHLPEVLGRRAARDLRRGAPLRWDDLEGGPAGSGGP